MSKPNLTREPWPWPNNDEQDELLRHRVSPANWINPEPARNYNLVVLGGGTAGLVGAAGAAGLGARVALIENRMLGGDCLNFGCVPSKALLSAARRVHLRRKLDQHSNRGSDDEASNRDFLEALQTLRRQRASLAVHDSAERFRALGVDLFFGQARFRNAKQIEVDGRILNFRKALIATGARPILPSLPGLAEAHPLTNETLFDLRALPRRMLVIGGGPIGCEMAQAFARFGTQVILVEAAHQLLSRDDPDASRLLAQTLQSEGVELHLQTQVAGVQVQPQGKQVRLTSERGEFFCDCEQILVAVGRAPNVQHLDLERASIRYDVQRGVHVNDRQQTTNRRVYAAGDVCSPHKFTHAADFQSRRVLQNALFWGRARTSRQPIPRCTFTSPEVAQIGIEPAEVVAAGERVVTFTQPFSQVDRAVLEGETDGFVRLYVKRGSDRILGGTAVGPHAGEWIGVIGLAMQQNLGMLDLSQWLLPYPTRQDVFRKLGDQYRRTFLTPWSKRLLQFWFHGFRRGT